MNTKASLLLLLMFTFVFNACENKEQDLELNAEINEEVQFGFISQGRTNNAISYNDIVSMLHHYDKTRAMSLKNDLGEEDHRYVFFSKKDLKLFLDDVEMISNSKNIDFTGVSFVSSAYPRNHHEASKRGKRTLVLLPNTKVGNNDAVIFDPLVSDSNSPKTLQSIIEDFGYKDAQSIFTSDLNRLKRSNDIQSIGIGDQDLTYKKIVSMLAQYNTKTAEVLKDAIGKQDVTNSYMSIDKFKSYLAYVESLSNEKNIPLTGFNVVFGAYPNDYILKPEQRNYMSILLMPVTSIKGKNVMFDPLHSKEGKPMLTVDMLAKYGYHFDANLEDRLKVVPTRFSDEPSSSGNRANTTPPY